MTKKALPRAAWPVAARFKLDTIYTKEQWTAIFNCLWPDLDRMAFDRNPRIEPPTVSQRAAELGLEARHRDAHWKIVEAAARFHAGRAIEIAMRRMPAKKAGSIVGRYLKALRTLDPLFSDSRFLMAVPEEYPEMRAVLNTWPKTHETVAAILNGAKQIHSRRGAPRLDARKRFLDRLAEIFEAVTGKRSTTSTVLTDNGVHRGSTPFRKFAEYCIRPLDEESMHGLDEAVHDAVTRSKKGQN